MGGGGVSVYSGIPCRAEKDGQAKKVNIGSDWTVSNSYWKEMLGGGRGKLSLMQTLQ